MKLSDSKMATVHTSERREERFALPFEIAVSGINGEGEAFHITVQTRDVSGWGCGFLSPMELKKDDIVAIRVVTPEGPGAVLRPPIRFQVVHVEREAEAWVIGAWKMEPDDAWGIELETLARPQGGGVKLRKRDAGDESNESEGE